MRKFKPEGWYQENIETMVEDLLIYTDNLTPKRHTVYALGYNDIGPVADTINIWVFTFNIDEFNTEKYFNPLKPDSARVVYQIRPSGYGNPDSLPSPINMEVEIRDCDSVVVYTGELPYEVQKHQVYWWDGKDNDGEYTDPKKSPYLATITLTYQGGKGRPQGSVSRSTKTTNVPTIIAVPILTRIAPVVEKPTDGNRYLDIISGTSRPLYFSTVILTKEDNTETPYHCYSPDFDMVGNTVIVHPEGGILPLEYEIEKWEDILWGKVEIEWQEIRPEIYNYSLDRVWYADSTTLGKWTSQYIGWGWGWEENEADMSEGTIRYRVHIKNQIGFMQFQEAVTPRGTELFRVSVKGNYANDIVKWASSYIGVPYVHDTYPPPKGRNIYYDPPWNDGNILTKCAKYRNSGYEGTECAGLAGWSYIWVGEDLDNNPATVDSVDIDNTNATMLKTYYGKADQEPDSARDGDMWFINNDNKPATIEHVGIFIVENSERKIIHASAKLYNEVVKVSCSPWWTSHFAGLGRRPHN